MEISSKCQHQEWISYDVNKVTPLLERTNRVPISATKAGLPFQEVNLWVYFRFSQFVLFKQESSVTNDSQRGLSFNNVYLYYRDK